MDTHPLVPNISLGLVCPSLLEFLRGSRRLSSTRLGSTRSGHFGLEVLDTFSLYVLVLVPLFIGPPLLRFYLRPPCYYPVFYGLGGCRSDIPNLARINPCTTRAMLFCVWIPSCLRTIHLFCRAAELCHLVSQQCDGIDPALPKDYTRGGFDRIHPQAFFSYVIVVFLMPIATTWIYSRSEGNKALNHILVQAHRS